MLRFILSQTTAPSTEVRLISGWTTARPEVTVETTHTPDPNYWPKIHRQATASLERVTDSQERKMLEQALALADRDLKEHSAMASLDELGIFHPDEDSLWNYALGIWIANWVPTWALSQRVAAFRQIYETLLDDSLQHEAAHRELNNLPEKYRDALDAEARRMKMSDEDIQRRKHDHLIAQLLDDLGRNNPNHRDLGQSDTADAERLYKIVSQVPSINTLYKARFERKIQHGFDGFSPQVQNELIQKELKALEVLYPFQERSQVVLQAVEEYSKQVGQPLRSYGRLLQEYDSLDRFARQTSPRRAGAGLAERYQQDPEKFALELQSLIVSFQSQEAAAVRAQADRIRKEAEKRSERMRGALEKIRNSDVCFARGIAQVIEPGSIFAAVSELREALRLLRVAVDEPTNGLNALRQTEDPLLQQAASEAAEPLIQHSIPQLEVIVDLLTEMDHITGTPRSPGMSPSPAKERTESYLLETERNEVAEYQTTLRALHPEEMRQGRPLTLTEDDVRRLRNMSARVVERRRYSHEMRALNARIETRRDFDATQVLLNIILGMPDDPWRVVNWGWPILGLVQSMVAVEGSPRGIHLRLSLFPYASGEAVFRERGVKAGPLVAEFCERLLEALPSRPPGQDVPLEELRGQLDQQEPGRIKVHAMANQIFLATVDGDMQKAITYYQPLVNEVTNLKKEYDRITEVSEAGYEELAVESMSYSLEMEELLERINSHMKDGLEQYVAHEMSGVELEQLIIEYGVADFQDRAAAELTPGLLSKIPDLPRQFSENAGQLVREIIAGKLTEWFHSPGPENVSAQGAAIARFEDAALQHLMQSRVRDLRSLNLGADASPQDIVDAYKKIPKESRGSVDNEAVRAYYRLTNPTYYARIVPSNSESQRTADLAMRDRRAETNYEIPPSVDRLSIKPATVVRGQSYNIHIRGNLRPETCFDARIQRPDGNVIEINNWMRKLYGSHTVRRNDDLGEWRVLAIRPHHNPGEHAGKFQVKANGQAWASWTIKSETTELSNIKPVITGARASMHGKVGEPIAPYQVTATNEPTLYEAKGLPTGLSIDSKTGMISGTPRRAVSKEIQVCATNASGRGDWVTLHLTFQDDAEHDQSSPVVDIAVAYKALRHSILTDVRSQQEEKRYSAERLTYYRDTVGPRLKEMIEAVPKEKTAVIVVGDARHLKDLDAAIPEAFFDQGRFREIVLMSLDPEGTSKALTELARGRAAWRDTRIRIEALDFSVRERELFDAIQIGMAQSRSVNEAYDDAKNAFTESVTPDYINKRYPQSFPVNANRGYASLVIALDALEIPQTLMTLVDRAAYSRSRDADVPLPLGPWARSISSFYRALRKDAKCRDVSEQFVLKIFKNYVQLLTWMADPNRGCVISLSSLGMVNVRKTINPNDPLKGGEIVNAGKISDWSITPNESDGSSDWYNTFNSMTDALFQGMLSNYEFQTESLLGTVSTGNKKYTFDGPAVNMFRMMPGYAGRVHRKLTVQESLNKGEDKDREAIAKDIQDALRHANRILSSGHADALLYGAVADQYDTLNTMLQLDIKISLPNQPIATPPMSEARFVQEFMRRLEELDKRYSCSTIIFDPNGGVVGTHTYEYGNTLVAQNEMLRITQDAVQVITVPVPSNDPPDQSDGAEPQSIVGRLGGWPVYGILMPILEEAFRYGSWHSFAVLPFFWGMVVAFPILHALLHVPVDYSYYRSHGWKDGLKRFGSRVGLSSIFGLLPWLFIRHYGLDPHLFNGVIWPLVSGVLSHIFNNIVIVGILGHSLRMSIPTNLRLNKAA